MGAGAWLGPRRGCREGRPQGRRLRCRRERVGRTVTLLAHIWNRSLHCLLIKPGKPYCGRGIYSEKWPLLIFGILFLCPFSKATGIYLVKKKLISLFDLHVEMNHIKFQVKSLPFVECLLNLSRFISSAHGLLEVYLSSVF